MLHLLMAAGWLVLGAVLLSRQWSNPNFSASMRGTGIPLGWFCVAMAGYNLLRWWLNRRAKEPPSSGLEGRRLRPRRLKAPEQIGPSSPPDPEFGFTSDPSPPR